MYHTSPHFRIYFGNARDNIFPSTYLNLQPNQDAFSLPACARLRKDMPLDELVCARQVHGTQGLIISSREQASRTRPFYFEADYLVTQTPRVGVGVMTADCLPVVLYDSVHRATAVIHAGWPGTLQGIVLKACETLREQYGTRVEDLEVFLGPSAKVCCYEVQEDLVAAFKDFSFIDHVIQRRDKKIFFDVPLCNVLLLKEAGVRLAAIHLDYNVCTMCNHEFCSYRRHGKASGRQVTVATVL